MNKSLVKDKVVIVTGASKGIGLATSLLLVEKGAQVILAARNKEALEKACGLIEATGGSCILIPTDIRQEDEVKTLIAQVVDRYGRIDILINNAGISMRALFEEVDLKVLHRLMDTNFWGTVYCSKYALPHLLKSKGSLVGISSIAGYKGLPGRTGYTASKAAMQGLLDVIRMENLKKGLHVLVACPGFTASNIRNVALSKDGTSQGETPLDEGKLMTAEQVATKIADAIEKRKRTLILTTQGRLTVLINKFIPSLMDKVVYNHMAKEPDSPFK